jgi:signal transduction histidine kinase
VQIYGDSYRLGQVITHLLNNAVKFTPPGGTIGLELINDPQAGTVYCTIWDTGIGIAEEDFPKLFRPFVQLDGRLNRRYEGAGLGLAVAAGLVRLHGGTISATSEVGRGSRFTVMLPCQASSTLVASDGSNQTVNTSSRHSISSWSGHHVTIPAGGTNL